MAPRSHRNPIARLQSSAFRTEIHWVFFALLVLVLCCAHAQAARFADRIHYTQPDGTVLELRGEGNEYQAVYESLDGYTVVFVPEVRAYHYATLSPAGDALVSAGLPVGQGNPGELGLAQHLRINPGVAREQARQARAEFESRMAIRERWTELKTSRQENPGLQPKMLRYGPTLGTKCGLTLLIDFDDTPTTLSVSAVEAFLNGDHYSANGNKGSVKEYYTEVSNGKVLYTNLVIGFIRIPKTLHPRDYYNDLNHYASLPTTELIRDAIRILTNQPNYMTEIVPKLDAVSVNEAGDVLAANVFIAGADSGVWSKGLWPHMDLMITTVGPQELWPGGKRVNMYQMSTTTFKGGPLQIGVFCHETGHLLCGFPDIYDYDSQSDGGAGGFCLMNGSSDNTNPEHFCAYLKYMAGWATVTELLPGPAQTFALSAPGTNASHFLRYRPVPFNRQPGHEYFMIENRQRTGRDASIPGSGILVWHIDELGDNDNQSLLPNATHANYEITLVQADNRWDLQHNVNNGDATDPFYSGNPARGYLNRFSDSTLPGAAWWDGTRSGLDLRDFSAKGMQMTMTAEIRPSAILRDPISQSVNAGDDLFLSVLMATNRLYSYSWLKGGNPLAATDRIKGADGPTLVIRGAFGSDAGGYSVVVSGPADYHETSRVAQVTVTSLPHLASIDLGDAGDRSGNTVIVNDGFQVSAAGTGLEGVADGCRFLSEAVAGDFDVRVSVVDMSPEEGQLLIFGRPVAGQAGLMVRAALDPGSPSAAVMLQPDLFLDTTIQALARFGEDAPTVQLAHGQGAPPLNSWVRLKREGDLISFYFSSDGLKWDLLNTIALPLGPHVYVGPVVTSGNPLVRAVSNLKGYTLQPSSAPTFAIASILNSAREGTTGRARFTVTASRNGPLQATYTLRDSSLNGIAYERLDGQLSFPAGTNVAFIDVVPINDTKAQPPTLVTVSLKTNGVTQASASVILFDDEELGHGLKREVYSPLSGTAVADLTTHYLYPGTAALGTVTNFESSILQNSGQVLSGYLTPPVTGPYTFYLASANASELWLSPDAAPEKAAKIAEEPGTNTKRNWIGYGPTNHISAPIVLTQGIWYFVKAVHKAGLGTPHLAVAWQPPGTEPPAPGSAPIAGDYLTWSLPAQAGALTGQLILTQSSSGHHRLSFENPSRRSLILEVSSDLKQWVPIWTTDQSGDVDISVLDAGASGRPFRFYRLNGR
jgi:M6 family metalloprotease-like protein